MHRNAAQCLLWARLKDGYPTRQWIMPRCITMWSQQGSADSSLKGCTVHISGLTGYVVSVIMTLPAAMEGSEPGTG